MKVPNVLKSDVKIVLIVPILSVCPSLWSNVNLSVPPAQVIISVSKLIGTAVGLSTSRFQESLAIVNNFAGSDKSIQVTHNIYLFLLLYTHSVYPSHEEDVCESVYFIQSA